MNYMARAILAYQMPNIPTVNNIKICNEDRKKLVMSIVCNHFGISKEVIVSKTKKREIVYPRQIVAYLLHVTTTLTFYEISVFLGGKEHTTALHSFNTIKDLKCYDEKIRDEVDFLRNKI